MSVLTSKGFDLAIGSAARHLKGVLQPRRGRGLALAQQTLQKANLANLSDGELQAFAMELQKEIMATKAEAANATKAIAQEQAKVAMEAYGGARGRWELKVPSTIAANDPHLQASTLNTAGLFLLVRDRALAKRVAARFAAGVLQARQADEGKKQKADKAMDPYAFFARPWGDKAEQQYWSLVCGAWLGRARNGILAGAYSQAGMEWCRIVAEIDERTTHICRFLHMRRILVSSAVALNANLVAPTTTSNWIEEIPPPPIGGLSAETEKPLLLLPPLEPGGKPRVLAQRTAEHKPGDGVFDMGKYTQFVTDEEIAQTVGPPPYHFLCRSLLVPDDYQDPLGLQAISEQKPIPADISQFIQQTQVP